MHAAPRSPNCSSNGPCGCTSSTRFSRTPANSTGSSPQTTRSAASKPCFMAFIFDSALPVRVFRPVLLRGIPAIGLDRLLRCRGGHPRPPNFMRFPRRDAHRTGCADFPRPAPTGVTARHTADDHFRLVSRNDTVARINLFPTAEFARKPSDTLTDC